jgi:hypothetical protein
MEHINKSRKISKCFRILIEFKVSVWVEIVNIRPRNIKRDVVFVIAIKDSLQILNWSVTPSALVPSKSPLRNEDRITNKFEVVGNNLVRYFSLHHIDVCYTTSSNCWQVNSAIDDVILYPPVLGMSKFVEHSYPGILFVLIHEERMSSVHVSTWERTSFIWSRDVSGPHAINSISKEEVLVSSFSKTKDSTEISLWWGISSHINPVKVRVKDHAFDCENIRGLIKWSVLEVQLESRSGLNANKGWKLSLSKRAVVSGNDIIRYLSRDSHIRRVLAILILDPCPFNVDNVSLNNSEGHVNVLKNTSNMLEIKLSLRKGKVRLSRSLG